MAEIEGPGGGCAAQQRLGSLDRLMLWSVRQIAVAGLGCCAVDRAWRECLGEHGVATSVRLKAFLAVTAAAATRPISVGLPCRGCVTPDERDLLATIAATRRGDFETAHTLLARFARPDRIDALAHAAELVGESLTLPDLAMS